MDVTFLLKILQQLLGTCSRGSQPPSLYGLGLGERGGVTSVHNPLANIISVTIHYERWSPEHMRYPSSVSGNRWRIMGLQNKFKSLGHGRLSMLCLLPLQSPHISSCPRLSFVFLHLPLHMAGSPWDLFFNNKSKGKYKLYKLKSLGIFCKIRFTYILKTKGGQIS